MKRVSQAAGRQSRWRGTGVGGAGAGKPPRRPRPRPRASPSVRQRRRLTERTTPASDATLAEVLRRV